MDVRQQDVERIVVEVLKKMMSDQPTAAATTVVAASGCDCGDFGLFDRLEDAVQAAEAAQKKISTVAMRDKIIAAIRKAGLENAKAFAEIAHNETGMGRVSDKIAKNILVCERTPGTECLSPMAISGDMGLTLIENAPWGVIASVTPSTNPTATVINNAISMIAGQLCLAPQSTQRASRRHSGPEQGHHRSHRRCQPACRRKGTHHRSGAGALLASSHQAARGDRW
ncbi:MAG: hypothetical protein ACLU6O_08040 [Bilophila wadsworthia]